jgi:hypothetical protein
MGARDFRWALWSTRTRRTSTRLRAFSWQGCDGYLCRMTGCSAVKLKGSRDREPGPYCRSPTRPWARRIWFLTVDPWHPEREDLHALRKPTGPQTPPKPADNCHMAGFARRLGLLRLPPGGHTR